MSCVSSQLRLSPEEHAERSRQKHQETVRDCLTFPRTAIDIGGVNEIVLHAAIVQFFLHDNHLHDDPECPDLSIRKRRYGFATLTTRVFIGTAHDWATGNVGIELLSKSQVKDICGDWDGRVKARSDTDERHVFFHWNDAVTPMYGSNVDRDRMPSVYLKDERPSYLKTYHIAIPRFPQMGDEILFQLQHTHKGVKAMPWFFKDGECGYDTAVQEYQERKEIRLVRVKKTPSDYHNGGFKTDVSVVWSGCYYHEFEAYCQEHFVNTENMAMIDGSIVCHDWEVTSTIAEDDDNAWEWMFSCCHHTLREQGIIDNGNVDKFIKTGDV